MVLKLRDPFRPSTASTAEVVIPGLHPVPYDLGAAGLADRSEHRDRALEAVEGVGLIVRDNLKRLMVGVAAFVASFHGVPPGSFSQDRG